MYNSNKAQLNLVYNAFQYYSDRISPEQMAGLDDEFIKWYDANDIKECKAVLSLMSQLLHDLTDGNMQKADALRWA